MLAALLKLLGAGIGYMTHRDDAATAKELAALNAQLEVIRTREGNPVFRFAVGIIAAATAFYYVAIVIDTVFQLRGDVASLPPQIAAIFGLVIGGMFIKSR